MCCGRFSVDGYFASPLMAGFLAAFSVSILSNQFSFPRGCAHLIVWAVAWLGGGLKGR